MTVQHGYTNTAGRWDHFGTALAALAPAEGQGDGEYVLAPGDVVFFTATVGRAVTESLRVRFVEGAIESIEGGIEAGMLKRLIERGGGGDAQRLSHIGWGCDPRADFDGVQLYGREGGGGADVRSVYGSVVIAFGANNDLGGTSVSSVHVDLATRVASVAVDGRPVLADGEFQLPELQITREPVSVTATSQAGLDLLGLCARSGRRRRPRRRGARRDRTAAPTCTAARRCPRARRCPGRPAAPCSVRSVLEAQAADLDAAQAILVEAGEVQLLSAHDHGAVGAMAGIISPSIPVLVVEGADGARVCAPINEGARPGCCGSGQTTAPCSIGCAGWVTCSRPRWTRRCTRSADWT